MFCSCFAKMKCLPHHLPVTFLPIACSITPQSTHVVASRLEVIFLIFNNLSYPIYLLNGITGTRVLLRHRSQPPLWLFLWSKKEISKLAVWCTAGHLNACFGFISYTRHDIKHAGFSIILDHHWTFLEPGCWGSAAVLFPPTSHPSHSWKEKFENFFSVSLLLLSTSAYKFGFGSGFKAKKGEAKARLEARLEAEASKRRRKKVE